MMGNLIRFLNVNNENSKIEQEQKLNCDNQENLHNDDDFKKSITEKKKIKFGLNHLTLKIIALIFMTLDHLCVTYLVSYGSIAYSILRNTGTLSMPLFIFLAVDSIFKTKHELKYIFTLLINALIYTIVCYVIIYTNIYFSSNITNYQDRYIGNIFVDLFLGVTIAYLIKLKNKKSWFSLIFIALYIISIFRFSYGNVYFIPILTEGGSLSFLLFACCISGYMIHEKLGSYFANKNHIPLSYYLENNRQKLINSATIIFFILIYLINLFLSTFNIGIFSIKKDTGVFNDYGVLSCIFIALYNGQKGFSNKFIKYSFYVYYPLHILSFYGLSLLV